MRCATINCFEEQLCEMLIQWVGKRLMLGWNNGLGVGF